ncbi:MAG TPA: diacylglycerol kinase family protein [Chryseolinea sp.]|nr:diacylglycerol kinase family protein [Chryseolinea sp.]
MREFLKSFIYALHGIWSGIADQRNLKFQLAVAIVVVGAGFYLSIRPIDWCIILMCISLVISLELINTAVENLVDLVTLERKPLAGKIKDIAAGAVLIASAISVIIGVIVFRKYLM